MDSGLPLIEISGEDDSLLVQVPAEDITSFACSPLQIVRPPGTSGSSLIRMTKDGTGADQPGCSSSQRNKENLNYNKSGSSNLSVEPQRMKKNKKTGGYNLRKSIAWDKAFSTEEGVLNSLELSMISGGLSKLGGEQLSLISEEGEELNSSGRFGGSTDLQTLEENLFKNNSSRSDDDKRMVSQTPERNRPRVDAKKSAVKAGRLTRLAPTSQKRLLNASTSKSAARNSKIPKVPTSKRDLSLPPKSDISMTPAASQIKSIRNAQPASVQRCTSSKVLSKTKTAPNARKVGPSCDSDPNTSQDTKKSMRNAGSERRLSVNQQSLHKNDPSVVKSNEVLAKSAAAAKPFNGTNRNAVVSLKSSDHGGCNGPHVQHQAAKPSGLRMPSPSLRFFSETKASASNSLLQKNSRSSHSNKSGIPSSQNFQAGAKVQEIRPPQGKLIDKAKQHDTMVTHHINESSSLNHPSRSDGSGSRDDGITYENNEKMEVRVLPGIQPKQCNNIQQQSLQVVEDAEYAQNSPNGNEMHQENTKALLVQVDCKENDRNLSIALPGNQDANLKMPESLKLQSCLQKDVSAANQCTDSHGVKDATMLAGKIVSAAHEGSSISTFDSNEAFVVPPFHDLDQEVQQRDIKTETSEENLLDCSIFHKLDEEFTGQAEAMLSVEESTADTIIIHAADNLRRPSCMYNSGCGREQNRCVETDKYIQEAINLGKEECFMPITVDALSREGTKEELQRCNSVTNTGNPDMSRGSNSDRNSTPWPINLDGPMSKVAAVNHMTMKYHAAERDPHVNVIVESCNTDLDFPVRLGQSSKTLNGWSGHPESLPDPSFIITHAAQSCNQLSVNDGKVLLNSCEKHVPQIPVDMDEVPAPLIAMEATLDCSDVEQHILDDLNSDTTGSKDGRDLKLTQLEAISPNRGHGPASRRASTNGSVEQPVGIDELASENGNDSSSLTGIDELEQQVFSDQDVVTTESRDGAQLEATSLNMGEETTFVRASASGCVKHLVGIDEHDAANKEELTPDASETGSDELQQQLSDNSNLVTTESRSDRDSKLTVQLEATSPSRGEGPAFRKASTSGSVEQLVEIDDLDIANGKETSDASQMETDELELQIFSDLNLVTTESKDGAQPGPRILQGPAFRSASTIGCAEQFVGIDELAAAIEEDLTSDAFKMGSDEHEQQLLDAPNLGTTESKDGREFIHTVQLEVTSLNERHRPASRRASTTRSIEQLVETDELDSANGKRPTLDASQIEIEQQVVNDLNFVNMESNDAADLEATSPNREQEPAFRRASTSGCVEQLVGIDELNTAKEEEVRSDASKMGTIELEQQLMDDTNLVTRESKDGEELMHTVRLEDSCPDKGKGPTSRRASTTGSDEQLVRIEEFDSANGKESRLDTSQIETDGIREKFVDDLNIVISESKDSSQLEATSPNRWQEPVFRRASTSVCVEQLVGIDELDTANEGGLTSDASQKGSVELQQQPANDSSSVTTQLNDGRELLGTAYLEVTSPNRGQGPALRRASTIERVKQLVGTVEVDTTDGEQLTLDASKMETDEVEQCIMDDPNADNAESKDGRELTCRAQLEATSLNMGQELAFRMASTTATADQLLGNEGAVTAIGAESTPDASLRMPQVEHLEDSSSNWSSHCVKPGDEVERRSMDDPVLDTRKSKDGRELTCTPQLEATSLDREQKPAFRMASTSTAAEQLLGNEEADTAIEEESMPDASVRMPQVENLIDSSSTLSSHCEKLRDEVEKCSMRDPNLDTSESKDGRELICTPQLEAINPNKEKEPAFRMASIGATVEWLLGNDKTDTAHGEKSTLVSRRKPQVVYHGDSSSSWSSHCERPSNEVEPRSTDDPNLDTTKSKDGKELTFTALEATSPNRKQDPAFRTASTSAAVGHLLGNDETDSAHGEDPAPDVSGRKPQVAHHRDSSGSWSSHCEGPSDEVEPRSMDDPTLDTRKSKDGKELTCTALDATSPNREQEPIFRMASTRATVGHLLGNDETDTAHGEEPTPDVSERKPQVAHHRDSSSTRYGHCKKPSEELERHSMDDPNLDTRESKDGRELTCTTQLEATNPNGEQEPAFRMASTSATIEHLLGNDEIYMVNGEELTTDASGRTPEVAHRDSSSTWSSHCEKPSVEIALNSQLFPRSSKDQDTDTIANREIDSEGPFDESGPTDSSIHQRLVVDKLDICTFQAKSKVRTSQCTDVQNGGNNSEWEGIGSKEDSTKMQLKSSEDDSKELVIRPPPEAVPFSDEWLAAFEAAGEEILTLKTGPVQNSPPEKSSAEPDPWSPVKRKTGPFDCTKFTNLQPPNSA